MLPRSFIRSRWVRVSEFPERNRFGKYSVILDRSYRRDENDALVPSSIKVAYVRDHPFLEYLNGLPHAPKATKAIYRASVRLGHLMATEAGPVLSDLKRAEDAWARYLSR